MTEVVRTLNVTETHQLLADLLTKGGTGKQFAQGIRNYTMACLMLEAGLRVGEVVQLHIDDLWFNSLPKISIIVRAEIAKNNSERTIPVSTLLSDAIKLMDKYYWTPTTAVAVGFAFYKGSPTEHLTTRQVERIIRKAAIRCLGRPIHPHILRHTFGSKLMRVTSMRTVQELLGHQHVSSTQIYTHPNEDDKKKAIDQLGQGEIETGLPPMGSPG